MRYRGLSHQTLCAILISYVVVLCVVLSFSALAQTSIHRSPTDPKELEKFLDAFLSKQMKELKIPGVTFSFVKDGKIFLTKGYGYANLEKKIPVDPGKTLFRVGSVSKLFTTTALMQLYEQGKLKLDDDVNNYLTKFKIEEKFSQPVTIANLLTHTAGFDDKLVAIANRKESEVVPLGEYLAKNMPRRVRPPGEVISYSNHGMALAGYIVEEVSGFPFAQYIDQNILKPLGMYHSSFVLPKSLASDMATGYEINLLGKPDSIPFDYMNKIAPAGSLNASAVDMAHFMIAHLQNGRYERAQILRERTAQEMHARHFTHHPKMLGIAYGFFEDERNNQKIIWHNGGWPGFYTLLYLLPEQNIGFFMSVNMLPQGGRLGARFLQQFFDRYFPWIQKREEVQQNRSAEILKRAKSVTGAYRVTRHPRHDLMKVATLFTGDVKITTDSEGALTIASLGQVGGEQWVEVEPFLYQRKSGKKGFIFFKEDETKRVRYMTTDGTSHERVADYEEALFHLNSFDALEKLSQAACAFMKEPAMEVQRQAQQVGCFAGYANLAISQSLAFLWFLKVDDLVYGVPWEVKLARTAALITNTVLTGALAVFAGLAWVNGYWNLEKRIFYTIIALANLGITAELYYWNLLEFGF